MRDATFDSRDSRLYSIIAFSVAAVVSSRIKRACGFRAFLCNFYQSAFCMYKCLAIFGCWNTKDDSRRSSFERQKKAQVGADNKSCLLIG